MKKRIICISISMFLFINVFIINPYRVQAYPWPDYSQIFLHFEQATEPVTTTWNADNLIKKYDEETKITLIGAPPGTPNKEVTVTAHQDGQTPHGNYISYWVEYTVNWSTTGFTNSKPPTKATIGISGFDNPKTLVPIDNASVVNGPFHLLTTKFPTVIAEFTSDNLLLNQATFKVNYSRPVPEPATVILLGSGLLRLITFREKIRKK